MKFTVSAALLLATFTQPIVSFPILDTIPDTGVSRIATLNNLSDAYTLTAFVPENKLFHGLKVNNLHLFRAEVTNSCPFEGNATEICPTGNQMVFGGTIYPISAVAGGQTLYVAEDGEMKITLPHSHSFPQRATPGWYGWTWYPLPVKQPGLVNCPSNDPMYNCQLPTGFWDFQAPNATKGGVTACGRLDLKDAIGLYAVTDSFNRTDCVHLTGLGTHNYTGINPPVYEY